MKYQSDIFWDDPRLEIAIDELDIYSILDESDVSYSLEGRNIGEHFIGLEYCPNCNKDGYHFGIHKDKFFGSCFVCKIYYTPLKLVSVLKDCSLKRAFDFLIENIEVDLDVTQRVNQIFKTKNKKEDYFYRGKDLLPDNKPITKQIIRKNKLLQTFLKERRIKGYSIKKYDLRIGINEHKNKIIFPVYVDAVLVSYQWRLLNKKYYHVPENLSKYLLWEDELSDNNPVLLVEGFLDAYHLRDFVDLYYPNQYNITTGFTKSVSAEQLQIIREKNVKKVICVFDGDSWFAYKRIKNNLSCDVDFVILHKNSDPNSLTFKQLNQIFKKEVNHG
jgi:DNA primase